MTEKSIKKFILGSFAYHPPEQEDKRVKKHWAFFLDFWSMSCTLVEFNCSNCIWVGGTKGSAHLRRIEPRTEIGPEQAVRTMMCLSITTCQLVVGGCRYRSVKTEAEFLCT